MPKNNNTIAKFSMIISTALELEKYREKAKESAKKAVRNLEDLLSLCVGDPELVMKRFKFKKLGVKVLDPDSLDNFCEQIDQQATVSAALDAVLWLMQQHPGKKWIVEPTAGGEGPDIKSEDKEVVAEVFAAVDPANNSKLTKDIEKISRELSAKHRYVIYRSPKPQSREESSGVKIHCLDWLPD